MGIVETLQEKAVEDADVLRALDAEGDKFSISRDVDFSFSSETANAAKSFSDFINECKFGVATIEKDSSYFVSVVINMPIKQHEIFSVAGFMTCIADKFGIAYEGWGCEVTRE